MSIVVRYSPVNVTMAKYDEIDARLRRRLTGRPMGSTTTFASALTVISVSARSGIHASSGKPGESN